MAGNSTISISFKLDGDDRGFRDLAKSADGLRTAMTGSLSVADKLNARLVNFAAIAAGVQAASRAFSQLEGAMRGLTDAYAVQQSAETKLQQVMANRMGATLDEVDAVKELAAEQQRLGVISDEVQLAGAQQMAAYLGEKDSISTLLPAMNDLIAQQEGLNATTGSAEAIAKAMGKAMEGQVGSLQRLGVTFTDAQAKVMQFGTEEERAAVLADVIESSVGGMNAALAQTDSGKQQQLANRLGDIREHLGAMMTGYMPFVTMAAQASQAAAGVATLSTGFVSLTKSIISGTAAFAKHTAAIVKNTAVTVAQRAASLAASAAAKAWSAVQAVLNAILRANPIGLIVMAVGALVAAFVAAYNRCDKFREICDKVWAVIKKVAAVVWDSLVAAFEAVTGAIRKAWDWLQRFLGIGKNKVEVEAEVTTTERRGTSGITGKYENYGTSGIEKATKVYHEFPKTIAECEESLAVLTERWKNAETEEDRIAAQDAIGRIQATKDALEAQGKAVEEVTDRWHEQCLSLNDVNDNLEILRERFNAATDDITRADYAAQIRQHEELADAMGLAGQVLDDTGPKWDGNATTLRGIGDNIAILTERLQDASADEAAWINRSIDEWNRKADAIKNAGKEEERSVMSASEAMRRGYGETKNLAGGINSISDALTDSSGVWEMITGVIDGFLQIFDSFSAVIEIIRSLTQVTQQQGEAAETQGIQEATAAATATSAKAAEAGADIAQGAAAQTAATGEMTEAAAETMSAHASIPFVGIAMAAAMVATMVATLLSLPKLAKGGLAAGPTLAMVGEYPGAGSNPEVIAPLDRLRSMLKTDDDRYGRVEFKIEGRTLVGVLNKVNDLSSRR